MARCLYNSDFATFLHTDSASIYRILDDNYHGEALTTTRDAWKAEIDIMKNVVSSLNNVDGQIIFEYDIPRLGKRIDVVLLYRGIVFCLEFKVGESKILETNIDQVLDYALDLKNFHKFSEDKVIAPILVATNYSNRSTSIQMSVYDDRVINPLVTGKAGISALIETVLEEFPSEAPVHNDWVISPYAPTPTIVEAAKTLYESHSVENITRHEADKVSTDTTIKYILDVIQRSKTNGEKSICFVTGVPGAGKTLVGLNIAIQRSDAEKGEHAVFLSGNFPLVTVLQEALARDKVEQAKQQNSSITKTEALRSTSAFIQIIHKYRDSFVGNENIPPERIAIFDEAQRAWTHDMIQKFMATKKGIIKKTTLEAYSRPRANGIIALTVRDGDELLSVCLTNGQQEMLMALRSGRAIRFNESTVRPMGRSASGVRGVTLADENTDEVVGLICVEPYGGSDILVVSEKGYGKRSELDEYRVTNRGGKGVKTLNITDKTGDLIAIKDVKDGDDLMIINKSGILIRIAVDTLRVMGRATQGVRLINLRNNDEIAAVTKVSADIIETEELEESLNDETAIDVETIVTDDNEVSEETNENNNNQ